MVKCDLHSMVQHVQMYIPWTEVSLGSHPWCQGTWSTLHGCLRGVKAGPGLGPSDRTAGPELAMAPLLLLLSLLVPATLPCGPISVPSGNSFCATQSCKLHPFTTATAKAGLVWHLPSPGTHIYNFRPCSYYNPVSCTCAVADASCDAGYTMDADGTKCYKLRYPMLLSVSAL